MPCRVVPCLAVNVAGIYEQPPFTALLELAHGLQQRSSKTCTFAPLHVNITLEGKKIRPTDTTTQDGMQPLQRQIYENLSLCNYLAQAIRLSFGRQFFLTVAHQCKRVWFYVATYWTPLEYDFNTILQLSLQQPISFFIPSSLLYSTSECSNSHVTLSTFSLKPSLSCMVIAWGLVNSCWVVGFYLWT